VRWYHASSATLNLVRSFTTGGFADLRYVHDWNKGFVSNAANARYEKIARDIDKAMKFMAACGADFEAMKTTEFFAAHEALLLDYERPLVRTDSRTGELYSTSAHFLWVGERTRDLAGAHIDFVSRIRNPIGVKVSAGADVDDLLRMIDALDPTREPGRLTFITRMGAGRIREALPSIVEKVTASGAQVTCVCDPMHGNTETTPEGIKTRRFDRILSELEQAFDLHERLGGHLGGVHFELTGEDVTECVGGACGLAPADLKRAYRSQVDPRLNYEQALEMALLIARRMAGAAR